MVESEEVEGVMERQEREDVDDHDHLPGQTTTVSDILCPLVQADCSAG
jgi:hypothetical protein